MVYEGFDLWLNHEVYSGFKHHLNDSLYDMCAALLAVGLLMINLKFRDKTIR
jgi:hypothetical protein